MKICLTSDLHYGFGKHDNIYKRFFGKVNKNKPDLILVAGDLISAKQKQWKHIFSALRDTQSDIPIYFVFGNHDYWEWKFKRDIIWKKNSHSIENVIRTVPELAETYGILYLPKHPYISDNLNIHGFDSWYWLDSPPTNDKYHMPSYVGDVSTPIYLRNRAEKQLENIPSKDPNKVNIIVTHFNMGLNNFQAPWHWLNEIQKRADICCFGHTHAYYNRYRDGIMYMNSGSDYEDPKASYFEVL